MNRRDALKAIGVSIGTCLGLPGLPLVGAAAEPVMLSAVHTTWIDVDELGFTVITHRGNLGHFSPDDIDMIVGPMQKGFQRSKLVGGKLENLSFEVIDRQLWIADRSSWKVPYRLRTLEQSFPSGKVSKLS